VIRAFLVAVAVATLLAGASAGAIAPTAPKGLTGIALDGSVGLAWQSVSGADHYSVYRGTSPSAVTTQVTPDGGVTSTSFTDSSAANGTTYFYVVRAITLGLESSDSLITQSTPAARSCSSGTGGRRAGGWEARHRSPRAASRAMQRRRASIAAARST
jgi:hypothetical protein